MGTSTWYAADLTFDGKLLTKISTGEVVENFGSRLYRGCTAKEINDFVLNHVRKALTRYDNKV